MDSRFRIGGQLYTPEELGLERLTIEGHSYIDMTPFWLDSRKSDEVRKRIEELRELSRLKEIEERRSGRK
ncbi:MAG: hypothetical protein NC300_05790 [Bacteroidales bacterium]|nr:hypothetical protein [Clostridium sp.]MCM1203634.1 hypothetical protein [Bacteroidales bacterium]